MPSVDAVQDQIRRLEGFEVLLRSPNLAGDVRLTQGGLPDFPFLHPAPDELSVREWVRERAAAPYLGWECVVLDGSGRRVPAAAPLGDVRATYDEQPAPESPFGPEAAGLPPAQRGK